MVVGRIEAAGAGVDCGLSGLWLSGVPLDTLGRAAGELARVPGALGAMCAPAGAERDAPREDALRILADAFAPRPVSAAPRRGAPASPFLARIGRANILLQVPTDSATPALARSLAAEGKAVHFAGVHSPARLDAVLEGWLGGLETRAAAGGSLEGAVSIFEVDAERIDRTFDAILRARMAAAPTDSIAAAYRVLLGRVGWAVAAVCRRRISMAGNGARAAALAKKGAPRPGLLVMAPLERLAEFEAPGVALAVPYAAALNLPGGRAPRPGGTALDTGYDEGKRLCDKLANYQLDLDRIAAELEAGP